MIKYPVNLGQPAPLSVWSRFSLFANRIFMVRGRHKRPESVIHDISDGIDPDRKMQFCPHLR